jgi:hypothetical protein
MLASSTEESEVRDPWVTRMRSLPAMVVSTTLEGPLDWPDATVVSGDAVDVVARLKEESEVPLRSHGSLSLNRAPRQMRLPVVRPEPPPRHRTSKMTRAQLAERDRAGHTTIETDPHHRLRIDPATANHRTGTGFRTASTGRHRTI